MRQCFYDRLLERTSCRLCQLSSRARSNFWYCKIVIFSAMKTLRIVLVISVVLAVLIVQSAGFVCLRKPGVPINSPSRRARSCVRPQPRGAIQDRGEVGVLLARWRSRREDYDDFDTNGDYYEYDDYHRSDEPPRRPREERPRPLFLPGKLSQALVAGVFVLGIGTGVTVDSAINTDPRDLASRDAIDRNAPNPNICQKYGSSAMVVDQRVFVTFNPFSLHVSQADTKPGCVLRPANVIEVLQRKRNLLTNEDVETCKSGMNTWAFVGDLNDHPQLSCVYQSDDAQNEFLSNPKYGLGEDVYDDDRAAAAERAGTPSEPANGPRVMSGSIQTVVTDRARM